MSTVAENHEASSGYARLMQRVESLEPLIDAESDEAERLRHMSDRLYEAFRDAGLWHMMTPRALGGAELTWSEGMRIVERVARVDGSTAWCLMVSGVQNGGCGALLDEAGCAEVFAEGTNTNVAGQGIPRGMARRVDGGYMIRGDWSYGSGIFHANWIHSGSIQFEDGKPVMTEDGDPRVLISYVPREAIELRDNWDVMGLRGTGSFDYGLAEELFVPDHRVYPHSKCQVERGGNQYSFGITGLTTWGHTSFALGVGRHALDELAAIARGKGGPFGLLADQPSFQEKYARAEAKYRSARAFVYDTWEGIDETFARGGLASLEQLALARLGMRHAHEVMSEVCTFAYNGGGGIALRPSRLQRCYRDLHAGLQHILLSDSIMQDCGRVLMGHVNEDARWDLVGLR